MAGFALNYMPTWYYDVNFMAAIGVLAGVLLAVLICGGLCITALVEEHRQKKP